MYHGALGERTMRRGIEDNRFTTGSEIQVCTLAL